MTTFRVVDHLNALIKDGFIEKKNAAAVARVIVRAYNAGHEAKKPLQLNEIYKTEEKKDGKRKGQDVLVRSESVLHVGSRL